MNSMMPEAVKNKIQAHVDAILRRNGGERAPQDGVDIEWCSHIYESYESLIGRGHGTEQALGMALEQFGDGTEIHTVTRQLQWQEDMTWVLKKTPMAIWAWIAIEALLTPVWIATLRHPESVGIETWLLIVPAVGVLLALLAFVLRLSVARLRHAAQGFQGTAMCMAWTVLLILPIIALLQIVASVPVVLTEPRVIMLALILASIPLLITRSR